MPVTNEPTGDSPPKGAFGELIRLQSEFSSRLAEETVKYLRNLQGVMGPASPGTVVLPDAEFEAKASTVAGAAATLTIELENLQRVHCLVTPKLTPLVSAEGVTWFPDASPGLTSLMMPPGTTRTIEYSVQVPGDLPSGRYHGALLLVGFRDSALPVAIEVKEIPRKAKARKKPKVKRSKKVVKAADRTSTRKSRGRAVGKRAGRKTAAKAAGRSKATKKAARTAAAKKATKTGARKVTTKKASRTAAKPAKQTSARPAVTKKTKKKNTSAKAAGTKRAKQPKRSPRRAR